MITAAYVFGGLPGPGLSRFLNRSISSSNQMKILRLPSPAELILFSGFWAYFCAVSTLHPQICATFLVINILISGIVLFPCNRTETSPSWTVDYFVTRNTKRIASAMTIKDSPIDVKSIDFASLKNYILGTGPCGPAPLINLSGQSERESALRELQDRPRLQAALVGFSYRVSYLFTSFIRPYWNGLISIIYRTAYILSSSFTQKTSRKKLFSGIKNILYKLRTHQEAVWQE